ncbi:MAG: HEPN domain-containing protein [Methanosarcinales archaeon]|uniref:HEPN domain-containing protein n=1 Tax=Candidatus Ethanoperedens thermophilum TaxID=2766897 RepID=A0A848DBM4_9EURY|nr:HEPN domain-containing protein [Candidatus Ethanoperedens thermophilum]
MRKEVKEWWKQAKRDLITAENCKNSKDYYACAFFCQQSVEKGLKAMYIAKKRMSPGTTHSYLPCNRDRYAIPVLHILKAIDARVCYHAVSGCGLWNAL